MSLFGRLIVIFFALFFAIIAAGITLAVGIVAPDWAGVDSDPFERVSFFIVSFFATSFVGAVALLPALVVILIAEAARLRNFLYYGVGGALVGLASYFGSDISVRLENTTDVDTGWQYFTAGGCGGNYWRAGLLGSGGAQCRPLARSTRGLACSPIQRCFQSIITPKQLAIRCHKAW